MRLVGQLDSYIVYSKKNPIWNKNRRVLRFFYFSLQCIGVCLLYLTKNNNISYLVSYFVIAMIISRIIDTDLYTDQFRLSEKKLWHNIESSRDPRCINVHNISRRHCGNYNHAFLSGWTIKRMMQKTRGMCDRWGNAEIY